MQKPFAFEPLCSDYAVHYYSHLNFALNEKKETKMINETLPDFISFNSTFQDALNWTIYTTDLKYENWWFNISTSLSVDDARANEDGINTTDHRSWWILKMDYVPYYAPNRPPVIKINTPLV